MLKCRFLSHAAFSLTIFILFPLVARSAPVDEGNETAIAPIPSVVSSNHFTVTVGKRASRPTNTSANSGLKPQTDLLSIQPIKCRD